MHGHIGGTDEREWMGIVKTLMAQQMQELKAAVGSRGRRCGAVERITQEERRADAEDRGHTGGAGQGGEGHMNKLEKRLTKLEIGEGVAPQPGGGDTAQERSTAWKPTHVIMGGWDSKAPREVAVEDATRWLAERCQNVAHLVLDHDTPRKYCGIVKIWCRTEGVNAVGFKLQKAIKSQQRAQRPRWAIAERSPPMGALFGGRRSHTPP